MTNQLISLEVPGGSIRLHEPSRLAASLYRAARYFLRLRRSDTLDTWMGRPPQLKGEDNLAYYVAAAGYTVLSTPLAGFGEGESGGRATLAGPDELNDLQASHRLADQIRMSHGPSSDVIRVIGEPVDNSPQYDSTGRGPQAWPAPPDSPSPRTRDRCKTAPS